MKLYGIVHNDVDYGLFIFSKPEKCEEDLLVEIIDDSGNIKHKNINDDDDDDEQIIKFKICDNVIYTIILRSRKNPKTVYGYKIYNIKDLNISAYDTFDNEKDNTPKSSSPIQEEDNEISLDIKRL